MSSVLFMATAIAAFNSSCTLNQVTWNRPLYSFDRTSNFNINLGSYGSLVFMEEAQAVLFPEALVFIDYGLSFFFWNL
jgi:hypothetical protein